MKKLLFAIGAIALLGLTSGCVDPVENVPNPDYDPINDEVKTQFVLNIAAADTDAKTKQSAGAVQQPTGNPAKIHFRGLDNASLFCFSLKNAAGTDFRDGAKMLAADIKATEGKTATDGGAVQYVDLSTALLAGAIDPSDIGSGKESRRIMDLNLKTGVNTLLFYGQAVTDPNEMDGKNDFGLIKGFPHETDMTKIGSRLISRLEEYTDETADLTDPTQRVQSEEAAAYHQIEAIIEAVYNTIFKLGFNNTSSSKKAYDQTPTYSGPIETNGEYDLTGVSIHWADYEMAVTGAGNSPIPGLVNDAHYHNNVYDNGYPKEPVKASPFEEILGTAYKAFKQVSAKELRAGSGASVARQMNDLYIVMSEAAVSAPTNEREKIAQVLITKIVDYLESMFDLPGTVVVTPATATDPAVMNTTLMWKAASGSIQNPGVIQALSTYGITNLAAPPTTIDNKTITLNNFPTIFDLPAGASTMRLWTDALQTQLGAYYPNCVLGDFYYLSHHIDVSQMVSPTATVTTMSVHDYVYPPALLYFGNSAIRVSQDNDVRNGDFLDGADDWENGTWNNKWEAQPGHVVSSTRAVAMINNVQYGVAMLETKVKFSDGAVSSGLQDNNKALHGNDPAEPNNIFVPGTNGKIKLTGVLVGGQPNKVGWDYLPVTEEISGENAKFDKMVYDKRVNGEGGIDQTDGNSSYEIEVPISGAASTPNYTLLYDNYRAAGQLPTVYVALEFRNELDKDFWGNANIVRQNGAFYLLGKLELTDELKASFSTVDATSGKSKWDMASTIMPPYDPSTGETLKGNDYVRVFMQDYVTKATFVINETSLQNAYVTVPDLRSSKLSFGLSVDLNWQTGLEFENVQL